MSEALAPQRAVEVKKVAVHGAAEIRFERRDGATRLATLYHHDPLRWLMPTPRAGDLPTAVLVTTSGGLVGGDRLDLAVSAGPGAAALVTSQAAEKVYRSTGADCRIDTAVTVEPGGWLEWMPQEAIVFDRARLRRSTRLDLHGDARALAGEMLVFGRAAHGERLTRGLVRDAWEVAVDGRLAWADALHLDGDLAATIGHPAAFDGAGACATLLLAGPGAAGHLETARDVAAGLPGVRAGASLVDGLLVMRALGREAKDVRRAYASLWSALRAAAAGLPARLPRLWEM